jgi:KDO2-lipid IV(A) lauroyltransferase
MFTYWLMRSASALSGVIPERLGFAIASNLGMLAYALNGSARRVARRNIWRALPDADVGLVEYHVRRAFRHQAWNYWQVCRLPQVTDQELDQRVKVTGIENIRRQVEQAQGGVLVTAHCGNLELGSQWLMRHGAPLVVLVEHIQPPELFDCLCQLRGRRGLRLVPVDGSLRSVYRLIKAGALVAVAADLDTTGQGVPTEFMGTLACLPDGYARLAVALEVPLLVVLSQWRSDGCIGGYISPPLPLHRGADRAESVRSAMRMALSHLERHIGSDPGQWVMFRSPWLGD